MSEPFVHRVRVRYSEVDPSRIAFNSHYYTWMDDALRGFASARSASLFERAQPVTRELVIRFLRPARFDDRLDVEVSLSAVEEAELTWALTVSRDGERLADARIVQGFDEPGGGRHRHVPAAVRSQLLLSPRPGLAARACGKLVRWGPGRDSIR